MRRGLGHGNLNVHGTFEGEGVDDWGSLSIISLDNVEKKEHTCKWFKVDKNRLFVSRLVAEVTHSAVGSV